MKLVSCKLSILADRKCNQSKDKITEKTKVLSLASINVFMHGILRVLQQKKVGACPNYKTLSQTRTEIVTILIFSQQPLLLSWCHDRNKLGVPHTET